jgi:hypothetical protein
MVYITKIMAFVESYLIILFSSRSAAVNLLEEFFTTVALFLFSRVLYG